VYPSTDGLEIRAPANVGPEVYLSDAPAVGDVESRRRVSPDDRERLASLALEQRGNGTLEALFAVGRFGHPESVTDIRDTKTAPKAP
jgi:hypothetical protein